jgi:hypothetical protein
MNKNRPSLVTYIALASTSALTLLAGTANAAVSTWDGSTNSDWDTAANWDPDGVPGSTDQVIISNGNAVTKTGNLDINNATGTNDDGLQLTNGTLNVSGNLSSFTSYGTNSNPTSNLGVSGGTTGTLAVGGTFSLGNKSDSFSRTFTYNIYTGSSLTANAFQGVTGSWSGATSGTGGWKLNVLGGSLNITDTFDFTNVATSSKSPIGQITIGSLGTATGGSVNIGTMSDDWSLFSGQYVLFNDDLGSLTFGKTNYANIGDVEALIDGDYIQKDAGITSDFSIADNGSSWTVTLGAAIPEPSSFATLAGVMALGAAMIRRRRA